MVIASLPLAADLYTLRHRWIANLPVSPVILVLGEALTCSAVATLVSAGLVLPVTLLLSGSSLGTSVAFVAQKAGAMVGMSLALTCLVPIRSSEGGAGQFILLGVLYTTATGLVELGFHWLPEHLNDAPELAVGLSLAVVCMLIGVGSRTLVAHRRTVNGPANC